MERSWCDPCGYRLELLGNWTVDQRSNPILKEIPSTYRRGRKGLQRWRYYGKPIDLAYIKTLQQATPWTQ